MPLLYDWHMEIPLLAVQTRQAQHAKQNRHCWGLLLVALLLAGCGTSTVSPVKPPDASKVPGSAALPAAGNLEASQKSCHPDTLTGAAALLGPFKSLTPEQAIGPEAAGSRVCWGGGLNKMTELESGRDCMTMLYSDASSEQGMRWPQQASYFMACGPGRYDRKLFEQFMMATVSGKVVGRAEFIGLTIPVIEIDAVYRLSDCLQGDTAPQCVHGYQQPQQRPQ